MQTRRRALFSTVRTEGAILPPDLLQRVADGDGDLRGLTADDYHLAAGERLGEVITRSWNRLVGAWAGFRDAAERLPGDDPGTTLTRERWLLVLFQELGYGRLQTARAVELGGKTYPVSHAWGNVPIHLVGVRVPLDTRTARVAGAAAHSPHGLLQELLNRSEERLWGFVSNGLELRVLRDNSSLTRQAYVQFDLEQLLEGEVYSDFVLLWLLCHESRVEAERPVECWLERWSQAAAEQGTRALEGLRQGVQGAIEALGTGFLAHPANAALKEALRAGELTTQDYYRELLRLVYRLLFLFVAEDRELLFDPAAGEEARGLYERFYSTRRLRRLAERRRGTRHADLWQSLRLVMRKLGDEEGSAELALPALGSFLWSGEAVRHLAGAELANADLLTAVRSLAFTEQAKVLRAVDYKNLGSEELGSVYESLLELHPDLNVDAAAFALTTAAGHERKTTGSYYTPSSLVHCLLDSALDPVLEEAASADDPERAILDLRVCDPATGSGHFLVAAAHRIAKRLAAVRTGDEEPAPEAVRAALRDVIGRCLYGVDVNPMAVELCKVSLWMEALEPGKPLSFLDAHIRWGNSLLGTTPELLAAGIPDDAFKAIEGDDRTVAGELKRRNKREREGQLTLDDEVLELETALAEDAAVLDAAADDTIAAVHEKEERFRAFERSPEHERAKLLADAWCAAFVQRKVEGAPHITQGVLRLLARDPASVPDDVRGEIERLAAEYRFFHWHVEFPTILAQHTCGFDVALGNPPWVRQELIRSIKPILGGVFDSFRSTADLSVFFLDLAVRVVRPGGFVGLLTPNKWFRAEYGESLRRSLVRRVTVELIVDFGHTRELFAGIDTFPAAVVLRTLASVAETGSALRFVRAYDADLRAASLSTLVRERSLSVDSSHLQPGGWRFEGPTTGHLVYRLLGENASLQELLGATSREVLTGLKTGLNAAYYLDSKSFELMVSMDPPSEQLIRRFLRGRDVARWRTRWTGYRHIVMPSSDNYEWPWSRASSERDAEAAFAAAYPAIFHHLQKFRLELERRVDRGRYWWELRSCDYYDVLSSHKIVVQCIAYYSRFAIDTDGMFANNTVLIIPTTSLYLLAVLNSRVTWWLMNRTCSPRKDGGLSVELRHLQAMPVPAVTLDLKDEIETCVRELLQLAPDGSTRGMLIYEQKLDKLVAEAFRLTDVDRHIIEDSLPERDPIATLVAAP